MNIDLGIMPGKALCCTMTRIVLIDIALFLLPFVVYGGWRWLIHGERGRREIMTDAPVFVLLLLGIVFAGAGLYFLASHESADTKGRYYPPVLKDGKIQPGHFEKSGLFVPSYPVPSRSVREK